MNEAEDRVAIGVIGIRGTITEDHTFQGKDMVPTGFSFNKFCIQELTAVIVEACDEIPFL